MHICDGKCDCGSTVGEEQSIQLRDRELTVMSCVLCGRVRLPSWRSCRITKRDQRALKSYNRNIERTIKRRGENRL